MSQIFHLGLHKTGTTTLQKHLFSCSERPYYGRHGCVDWDRKRVEWFEALLGRSLLSVKSNEKFIFSDESTLLRCGGMSGIDRVAAYITDRFNDPHVVLSIREPSALLRSAYFQSLRLRQNAAGFLPDGSKVIKHSPRWLALDEWLQVLIDNDAYSLIGLAKYKCVKELFTRHLGEERVHFLPLEWLKDNKALYSLTLKRLGFFESEIQKFFSAPPENTGKGKLLSREPPWISHWVRNPVRKKWLDNAFYFAELTGSTKIIEKLVYRSAYTFESSGREALNSICVSCAQEYLTVLSSMHRDD